MNRDLQYYARFLNSISTHHYIPQGEQLHLLFLKNGVLHSSITTANRLIQMYVRCDRVADARKMFDEMPERNCFTWNTLLEGYMKWGKVKDSLDLFYKMPNRNDFSWNVVISGLSKVGELGLARNFLNEMPSKNAKAWNSVIHGYARNGYPRMALSLFRELLDFTKYEMGELSCLDTFVLTTAIGACADSGYLNCGKQIHARIIVDMLELDSVLGSSLVNMYGKCGDLDNANHILNIMHYPDDYALSALISGYAKCGRMNDARRVFYTRTNCCVVLWNSMIAGYVANDDVWEALWIFEKMHKEGVVGDSSTFATVLNACGAAGVLETGLQLHAYVCRLGVSHDLIVASSLVDMYAKCGSPNHACDLFCELRMHDTVLLNSMIAIYSNCGRINDAKRIFENMPSRSLISWNSMVVGLSQNGFPIEALNIFCEMNSLDFPLDKFSLASIISSCASMSSLELGEQVFAKSIVVGLDSDEIISTSLIDFYSKCGFVENSRKLFYQMVRHDEVSWNSMLMGYATNGCGDRVLSLFHEMICAGFIPTGITFTAVLSACDHCGLVEEGRKWFYVMKHDYHIDPGVEHYSCMIDLLSRAGCLSEAVNIIELMPCKPDASMLSSVLRGCVAHGNKSLAKKVVEQILEIDPMNADVHVQLSSVFATSGEWEQSALVRKLMRDKEILKSPGQSWYEGNILLGVK